MKISYIVGALILFASVIPSFAIEGIQVSVQSSNVVLSWPSLTNETYIAQYRHTLESTDSWATLTNYFPASQTTNITYFVHSNSVDFGTPPSGGGTNTGGGVPNPGGTNDYSGPPGTNGIAGTGFYRVVRDGVHMWGITNGMVVNFLASTPVNKTLTRKFKANGGGVHPNDGGSSAASANQLWVKEGTWAPNNNWVICYASLTGDGTVDQRAVEMIVGGAGSPTDYDGVLGTLDAYGLHGNLSPGNNAQAGTVFTLQDSTTRGNLLGYLGDHRYENFYYFGHGNDSAISAYNGPVTGINMQQLAYAIGNVPLSMNDGDPVFDGWDPDVPTMVQPVMAQPNNFKSFA